MATAGNNAFLQAVSSPDPNNLVSILGAGINSKIYDGFFDENLIVSARGTGSILLQTGFYSTTRMEITQDGQIITNGSLTSDTLTVSTIESGTGILTFSEEISGLTDATYISNDGTGSGQYYVVNQDGTKVFSGYQEQDINADFTDATLICGAGEQNLAYVADGTQLFKINEIEIIDGPFEVGLQPVSILLLGSNIWLGQTDQITLFDIPTNSVTNIVDTTPNTPLDMAYGTTDDFVYFTDGTDTVYKVDQSTLVKSVYNSTPLPENVETLTCIVGTNKVWAKGSNGIYILDGGELVRTIDGDYSGSGQIKCVNPYVYCLSTTVGTITQFDIYGNIFKVITGLTSPQYLVSPVNADVQGARVVDDGTKVNTYLLETGAGPVVFTSNVIVNGNITYPTKYYGSADDPGGNQQSYVDGYTRFVIYWAVVLASPGTGGDTVTLIDLPVDFLKNSVQVSHNILTFPVGDDGSVLQPFAPVAKTSTVEANLGITGAVAGTYTGRTVFEFYPETQ